MLKNLLNDDVLCLWQLEGVSLIGYLDQALVAITNKFVDQIENVNTEIEYICEGLNWKIFKLHQKMPNLLR